MIRRRAVLALWRMLAGRLVKHFAKSVATFAVLSALVGLTMGWDHGFVEMLSLFLLVMSVIFPAGRMLQERVHGSLRFLASLPISGPEHAAGRVLLAGTFAIPATLVVTVVAVREQFVSLAASVPAGIVVWAALTAISTLITACHYGFATDRMIGLFARVALAGVVVSLLVSSFVPPQLSVLAWLTSPTGRTVAFALGVGAAVTPLWWAVRTISRCAPVFQEGTDSEFLAAFSMMERAFQRKGTR